MTSFEADPAAGSSNGMVYATAANAMPYVYQQAQYGTTSPPPMNAQYIDSAGNIYAMYSQQQPQAAVYDYSQQQQQVFAPAAVAQQMKPGTLPPGTAIGIGDYTVVVEQYLSEGALWVVDIMLLYMLTYDFQAVSRMSTSSELQNP